MEQTDSESCLVKGVKNGLQTSVSYEQYSATCNAAIWKPVFRESPNTEIALLKCPTLVR